MEVQPPHTAYGWSLGTNDPVCHRILDALLLETKVSLTHKLLTTFLAALCTIVNAHPLVPVSTDPDVPEILTPPAQLSMKTTPLHAPPGDFSHPPDIFGYQWLHVQHLVYTSGHNGAKNIF